MPAESLPSDESDTPITVEADNGAPWYSEISAQIEGGFDDPEVIAAFDPSKIVGRVLREFPGTEFENKDWAWRMLRWVRERGRIEDFEKVFDLEASDARRRGPIWLFRIPNPEGGWIRGKVERHYVIFYLSTPFPEPLRSRLLDFVERLRFAPCVTVQSVCWVDNDEIPA
jgi:hypothetical protein